jgi:hypothetical protein
MHRPKPSESDSRSNSRQHALLTRVTLASHVSFRSTKRSLQYVRLVSALVPGLLLFFVCIHISAGLSTAPFDYRSTSLAIGKSNAVRCLLRLLAQHRSVLAAPLDSQRDPARRSFVGDESAEQLLAVIAVVRGPSMLTRYLRNPYRIRS